MTRANPIIFSSRLDGASWFEKAAWFIVPPAAGTGLGLGSSWLFLTIGGRDDYESGHVQTWLPPATITSFAVAFTTFALLVILARPSARRSDASNRMPIGDRQTRTQEALLLVPCGLTVIIAVATAPKDSYRFQAAFVGALEVFVGPYLLWQQRRSSNNYDAEPPDRAESGQTHTVIEIPGSTDALVLLDHHMDPLVFDNLARLRRNGSERWSALPPQEGPPDYWIHASLDGDEVIARSLSGFVVRLDLASGEERGRDATT